MVRVKVGKGSQGATVMCHVYIHRCDSLTLVLCTTSIYIYMYLHVPYYIRTLATFFLRKTLIVMFR